MTIIKKQYESIYAVADGKWFEQQTETISEPDEDGSVYDFFVENVKGEEIEAEFREWLKGHESDYYFAIVKSKQGDDFYTVAYESYNRAAYACEIENPYE